MHQLCHQTNYPVGETNTNSDDDHNNPPLQLLDPPQHVATNNWTWVNKEVKNKVLHKNVAAKNEELKKFQEGFLEAEYKFANNVREQL
jgi:hypothetical protein